MSERRFGLLFVVVVAVISVVIVGIFTVLKLWPQKPQGDINNRDTIRVQVAPNTFYNVDIPIHAKLLETNMESSFVFDILTVSVVSVEPTLANAYTKISDNCWISVVSEDNWIAPSQLSFSRNVTFEGYADLESMELVEEREEYNPVIPIEEALWYPATGGFSTYSYRYASFEDTIKEYAAKMYYLYGEKPTQYYRDDTTFYIHSGDYFVGAKYINFNTSIGVTAKGQEAIDNAMSILYNP